jgi:hypothetical protein
VVRHDKVLEVLENSLQLNSIVKRIVMRDVIFVSLTVLFFALSLAYVYACEKLH